MQNGSNLTAAATALASAFALTPADAHALVTSAGSRERLLAVIERYLARMLATSPALVMSLLYRIDVSERAVKATIDSAPPGTLAARLAELILERQLRKLATRSAYRGD